MPSEGSVEPLGKSGDEQGYRVTINSKSVIVFFNEAKMVGRCTECQSGKCKHIDLIHLTYDLEANKFQWMNIIAYTLENCCSTNVRRLWSLVSDGMVSRGQPLHKDMRDARKNFNLLLYKSGQFYNSLEHKIKFIEDTPYMKDAMEKRDATKENFRDAIFNTINRNLASMDVYEAGLLSLMRIDFDTYGVDEKDLHSNWHRGKEWVFDSGAFWALMEMDGNGKI